MKKKEILKEYQKKINLFNYYNKFYFEENAPLVNDGEYDELKKDILLMEKAYDFLKSKKSPSKSIGFKPSKNFIKITHRAPMLSLSNAFSEEDLINFEKKIINFLSEKRNFKLSYSAEPKIDGISASLTYKNGNFVRFIKRRWSRRWRYN